MTKLKGITVWLTDKQRQQLDAIQQRLQQQLGLSISRSKVVLYMINIAADVLEKDPSKQPARRKLKP
jgi:hypothetical protein